MTYAPTVWVDGPEGGTPIEAADLNKIEQALVQLDSGLATAGMVQSVNGKVGAVVLGAVDVSASPAGHTHDPTAIGAATAGHTHTYADVGAAPTVHAHTSAQISDAASAATPNMVAKRDASGNASFNQASVVAAAPTAADHVTRKDYVDGKAAAAAPTLANLPAGATLTVFKSGGVWPARPTARADVMVIWKGVDPSPGIVTSGTGGMLDGIDSRFVTP